MNDSIKVNALCDELQTSHDLLTRGLGELQEIDMANDAYHLPQQLLASGLERLMKCYLCLVIEAKEGQFPTEEVLKDWGHSLTALLDEITKKHFGGMERPAVRSDFEFLTEDQHLRRIIGILSDFGKFARYYNFSLITGSKKTPIDPKKEWDSLEGEIERIEPYLQDENLEALQNNYYPAVNSKIVAKLENLIRAIARQFTLGKHGGRLLQLSPLLADFRNIRDSDLGKNDYRAST